jgi:hypothetical protein
MATPGTEGAKKARSTAKNAVGAQQCAACRKCQTELPKDDMRRKMALTTFAEGSPDAPSEEYEAIASVFKNRVGAPGFPKTQEGVFTAKDRKGRYQFQGYGSNQYNKADKGNLDPKECAALKRAADAVNKVQDNGSPDPYKDYTFFADANAKRKYTGDVIGGTAFGDKEF